MNDEKSRYELWAKEYGLRFEPNYSAFTEADCKAAWQASAAHSAERIAELEGQVAMLQDTLDKADRWLDFLNPEDLPAPIRSEFDAFLDSVGCLYEQPAEQYKRRVQAEVLEEAAVRHETWHGFDKHGTSEFLRYMASELRNPAAQAEGKGEK